MRWTRWQLDSFKTFAMWTIPSWAARRKTQSACEEHGWTGRYTGTVPKILAYGAMEVKFMAMSGSDDPWEADQLAGKTLGVSYRLQ